ncbi:HEPN domain-containing protein [Stenotrophomonas riyadhensis]|uniref:RiboL-PSP-HEPN domain-containing protein n=1 Tax=Stenotrophomonas riyadhensis TaxID=2859893 RepID=A0ABT2XGJ9_9GAMM|nr:HEPN domain-containing protein [Stenotrophomonas sp. CFS3442]MCV0322751.1 hypothetical protein [Stenotrophomonas sp. CFS3442]
MQPAIDAFRASVARVRHLGGIHKAVNHIATNALDPSDILRAQIVLIVSAMDYYVHEATAIGMTEVFEGKRPKTDAFSRFKVSIGAVPIAPALQSGWFEGEVRDRHSFLSFQQPEKIADAIRLFTSIKIWSRIGELLNQKEADLKAKLTLIVGRRNKIAHEADIDPSYPGLRWPILEQDVEIAIDFIEQIVEAMHEAIK